MNIQLLLEAIDAGKIDNSLGILYGTSPEVLQTQRMRWQRAIRCFAETFPGRDDVQLFSAPGRTEIGGNHTDHQHGCALAAAVNLDVIAVVAFHDEGVIRLYSEGHGRDELDLSDLSVHEDEKGKSASMIRGIVSRFAEMGVKVGGFDAFSTSDVLSGSGLSSSAAFETLVGSIINIKYNDCRADEAEIAKIGQYAENVYFGKGSGLLDQTVCSYGGFVFIDFLDTEKPYVEKYRFDFEQAGYNLCITDTKGSHSDLTEDYVAVPSEMKSVAREFGKVHLLVGQSPAKAGLPAVDQAGDHGVGAAGGSDLLPGHGGRCAGFQAGGGVFVVALQQTCACPEGEGAFGGDAAAQFQISAELVGVGDAGGQHI